MHGKEYSEEEARLITYINSVDEDTYTMGGLPRVEGLYIDMVVDEGFTSERNGHKLWAWFKNGFGEDDIYIPITVEDIPTLPFRIPLKIPHAQFNKMRSFLAENVEYLTDISKRELFLSEFDHHSCLKEGRLPYRWNLSEMANLTTSKTGVPMTLWVDDKGLYKKGRHYKRVKAYFDSNPNQYVSIGIESTVPVYGDVPENERKNVKIAQRWVGYNLPLLDDLADGKISEEEFENKMVKLDKKGKVPMVKITKPIKYGPLIDGYCLIVHPEHGRFNIASNDDISKPLCPIWFDWWTKVSVKKDCKRYIGVSDNESMYIFNIDDRMLKGACFGEKA